MSEERIETRVIQIDPKELKLLKENARFMRHEEFQRLVQNIKRDGVLTSAPFAWLDKTDGKYEVLSGNHRVKAAIEAGIASIPCIVTDDDIPEERRIAIQLSHNSITGQDDPDMLRHLYDKILNIDLKEYSGLDDKTLNLLDKASSQAMREANLEFQTLSIVFLPDELKKAQQVIDEAVNQVKGSPVIWLSKNEQYDKWMDAIETASAAQGVKNVSSAMKVVLKVFEDNLTQLSDGWYEKEKNDKTQYVPMSTVIGRTKIPAGSARKIKTALDRMVGRGEIPTNALWEGLEKLCSAYMDGEK